MRGGFIWINLLICTGQYTVLQQFVLTIVTYASKIVQVFNENNKN